MLVGESGASGMDSEEGDRDNPDFAGDMES